MRIHRTASLAFIVLGAPAVALAQADDSDTSVRQHAEVVSGDYIAVLPGYAIPDSGRGTQRNGFTMSIIYGNQMTTHFSVEGNVQGSIFETGRGHGTDFYQWGGTIDLVYGLTDRRSSPFMPFALIGLGGMYNDVFPQNRSAASFVAEGGIGFVTGSLYDGLKLRGDARYVRDTFESGYNDYRLMLGFEIPLGRVIERVVEKPVPQVQVKEVVKEVPRPWVDSDGDGVDDEHDKCPGTPHGLKVDADGCPIPGQVIPLNGVTFEFNKARLTPNAETVLDGVVPAFTGEPSLKVEIAGHTDGVGSAAYNLKLSQKRAEAVRSYLISRGVRPDQLVAKGYGKSQPLVSPERTAEDRERNRRVEFRILQK